MYPFMVHPPFFIRSQTAAVGYACAIHRDNKNATGYTSFFNGAHRPLQRATFPDVPRQLEKSCVFPPIFGRGYMYAFSPNHSTFVQSQKTDTSLTRKETIQ